MSSRYVNEFSLYDLCCAASVLSVIVIISAVMALVVITIFVN